MKYLALSLVVSISLVPCMSAALENPNAGMEDRVRSYFFDVPVMIDIAKCESEFRQYADSGGPLYGGAGAKMIGLYQVHTTVHASAASELGMNLSTPEGNMAYARHLYEREGTSPWMSSFSCWKFSTAIPENGQLLPVSTSGNPGALTLNVSYGMVHGQVKVLQQLLNRAGFTIAVEGAGSPGFETEKFGELTRSAVQKFQCDRGIVCTGDEYVTGFGYVGPKTRAALNNATEKSVVAHSVTPISMAPRDVQATASSVIATPESYSLEQLNEISRLQTQIAQLQESIARLRGAH